MHITQFCTGYKYQIAPLGSACSLQGLHPHLLVQVSDPRLWQGRHDWHGAQGGTEAVGISLFHREYLKVSTNSCLRGTALGHDSLGARLPEKEERRTRAPTGPRTGSLMDSRDRLAFTLSGLSCLSRGCWVATNIFRAWGKRTKGSSCTLCLNI